MIIPINRPPGSRALGRTAPLGAGRNRTSASASASAVQLPALPLDAGMLDDIAAGIAAAEPLWRSVVQHDAEQRTPVRLLATAAYEVWVIGWMPEQGVELHDHGDAGGVFLVTEGVLTEIRVEDGALVRDTLPQGSVRHLPLGLVHDVVNTGTAAATSIHVYSPPLTAMTHYDPATLQPQQTERVLPVPTVLGAHEGSALLHPSLPGAAAPTARQLAEVGHG